MRVLHVAAGNLFGGIERMLLTLVDASRQAESGGHEVAVAFDGRFARELRDAGSSPWVLGDARFSRPDTVWRARRALRRALAQQRYDAVIAHAPWSTALAAPAVRRANLPLFSWIHDAPHPDQWPERRVARMRPDRFICNSRYTAGLVARWMPGLATDVIHPPVAASAPSTDRAGVRREFGEPDDAVVVLTAARMSRGKGIACCSTRRSTCGGTSPSGSPAPRSARMRPHLSTSSRGRRWRRGTASACVCLVSVRTCRD
jgi:glycosyltransferase involved in cell wall biosynthesis